MMRSSIRINTRYNIQPLLDVRRGNAKNTIAVPGPWQSMKYKERLHITHSVRVKCSWVADAALQCLRSCAMGHYLFVFPSFALLSPFSQSDCG